MNLLKNAGCPAKYITVFLVDLYDNILLNNFAKKPAILTPEWIISC
jgi:hypothetical protein